MKLGGIWKKEKLCSVKNFVVNKGNSKLRFSLSNKHIVVFGGVGKLGQAISTGLIAEGARVTVASRTAKLKESDIKVPNGSRIDFVNVDASQETEMRALFSEYKNINGCVFCTTIRPMTKFLDSSIDTWRQSVVENSTSLYLSNLLAAEQFKEKLDGGTILNISSVYGIRAPDPSIYHGTDMGTEPDYPFIKGGTIALTKYMAAMYGKYGVRVNCIAPGGLEGTQPKSFKDKYTRKVALGRMMQGEDLVGPAVFLMSDASSYVTGVTLPVDGGFTL